MLLALLLPDPADERRPQQLKPAARLALNPPLAQPGGSDGLALRQGLLKFIADFANGDAAADPAYLDAGRALVPAAHWEEPPLVAGKGGRSGVRPSLSAALLLARALRRRSVSNSRR